VLYVLAIVILQDKNTDVYDFHIQSVLLFGSLMFLFYWLFSNLQNVNIQLNKEKDDVCLQNMQLTKINDSLLKQRIMTNHSALETIAHSEALIKEINSKASKPLHETSTEVQLKLRQLIHNNKLLVKDMAVDNYMVEKLALLKIHFPWISDTAAQICVYSTLGFTVLQIADMLNKSESTIINYRQELRNEFKLNSANDLNKFLADFFEKNCYLTDRTG
jgi:DNA-binding NarL/FixJ family response regulator